MDSTDLATRGEYLAALDTLLAGARLRIRLLDHDLGDQGWDTAARAGRLEAFMLGDPLRRVQILLGQGDYLTRRCPHLMNLLRYFGHRLEIRVTGEGEPMSGSFALGDDGLLLVRHHRDAWHGRFSGHDPGEVIRLGEAFAAAWERAPGGTLGFTTLGL